MTKSFTPGPWEIGKMHSVVTQTPDDQVRIRGPYAEETIKTYGGHVICETVSSNNARLIAVAPTMYEYIKKRADNGDSEARSIIAKAMGEK